MSHCKVFWAVGLSVLGLAAAATPTRAEPACIFDWAVPGSYDISGNFRGEVETVTARLTNDCRVAIALPGIFSGGPLQRDGRCLTFSFKVENERGTFKARWCGSYGVVPWQGRDVRATIARHRGRSNTGNK